MVMPSTYCPHPFKEIYSDNSGKYRVCCHGQDMEDMNELLPFEFFESDRMESIRQQLMSGEKPPECNRCWRLEESGEESYRHKAVRDWKYDDPDKISLKLRIGSNFCNLSCYMCNPKNSSTRKKELREIYGFARDKAFDGEFTSPYVATKNARWNEILDDILNNIHRVEKIRLTGGEPLQLPQQWKLLNSIPDEYAKDIEIGIDTNLTELGWKGNSIYDLKKKFKFVYLGISCDHYGDRLSFIRHPIDVKQFEKNLAEIRDNDFTHCINITASILNIDELDSIRKYYEIMGLNTRVHAVVSNSIHSICNLPESMKEEYIDRYWPQDMPLVVAELECKREPYKLQYGMKNLDDLAKHRNIDWRSMWSGFLQKIEEHEKADSLRM